MQRCSEHSKREPLLTGIQQARGMKEGKKSKLLAFGLSACWAWWGGKEVASQSWGTNSSKKQEESIILRVAQH